MSRLAYRVSRGLAVIGAFGGLFGGAPPMHAASNFTYEIAREFVYPEALCQMAFNDRGQLAYAVRDWSFPRRDKIYFRDGATETLVYSTDSSTTYPHLNCSGGMGLNNDGLIAVFSIAVGPSSGSGVAFLRPGFGLVSTKRGNGVLLQTRGNLNSAGEVAFDAGSGGWYYEFGILPVIEPPIYSRRGTGWPTSCQMSDKITQYGPVINERGQAARLVHGPWFGSGNYLMLEDFDRDRFRGSDYSCDDRVQRTRIALASEWGVTWDGPGFNAQTNPADPADKRAYVSFSTVGARHGGQHRFRVALVSPNRQTLAILADDVDFPGGHPLSPVWMDERNQVLFMVEWPDGPLVRQEMWIVDARRAPLSPNTNERRTPIAVWRRFEPLVVGPYDIGSGSWGTGSAVAYKQLVLNNRGEVAFALRRSNPDREAIFIARAAPGILPTNPIIPSGDALLEFGWRVLDCSGRAAFFPPGSAVPGPHPPCWVDPPLVAGYTFTADPGNFSFKTVVIPVPLPGGDASFAVEVAGSSFPLAAGEEFDFTENGFPSGVASFHITGIDPAENLSPSDPAAFVAGLTWVGEWVGSGGRTSFTMVPMEIDTDDDDSDGVINSAVTVR